MKTAIVGLGRMGLRHLQVVREIGLDLAGVSDTRRAALDRVEIETERRFSNTEELLKTARPECVIVATTAPGHFATVCQAVNAGARYILCEKPMASSLAECDRMIELCAARGVRLAVNHQMRFMPQYLETRRILESPEFGGWTSATLVAGNIGLATNATHYFELFRWMSGEPADEVTAWLARDSTPNPRGPDFVDYGGSLRVTTTRGKRLNVEIGCDQGHGITLVWAGRTGRLVADDLNGQLQLSVRAEPHRELPTTRYGMPSKDCEIRVPPSDTIAPTRAVLDALLNGGDPPSGEDGRAAVAIVAAAIESSENGHRTVKVAESMRQQHERSFAYA